MLFSRRKNNTYTLTTLSFLDKGISGLPFLAFPMGNKWWKYTEDFKNSVTPMNGGTRHPNVIFHSSETAQNDFWVCHDFLKYMVKWERISAFNTWLKNRKLKLCIFFGLNVFFNALSLIQINYQFSKLNTLISSYNLSFRVGV